MKSLGIALLSALVVLAGIWVTGGLITNNFDVAMALTAVWMGAAGLAALVLFLRRRSVGLPVLAGYVLVAVVAGLYLGRSQFMDDEVDENVAVASAAAPADPEPSAAAEKPRAKPKRNQRVASGSFKPLVHPGSGKATVIDLAKGGRVLTLTDFEVDNGPDLRVYLATGRGQDAGEFKDLGALKGNKGNQQYSIPKGTDIDRYDNVMIWCRAFSVGFIEAPLER